MITIKGGTVIGFDGEKHRILRSGTVVVEGDKIVHVGRGREGKTGREIDATGKIVIPGQISTHAHVGSQLLSRFLGEARGLREFVRSEFLHFAPIRRSGARSLYSLIDARASLRYGFAALVRGGVTSVVAYASDGGDEGRLMREVADEMGIRLFWAPIIRGGGYCLEDNGRVTTERDEAAGLRELDRAVSYIDRNSGGDSGRFQGLIAVDEYYLSSPTLRQRAKEAARSLGVSFTMHYLEQHREFFETMIATGKTPTQLLEEEGILDVRTILAHGIYVASGSLVNFPVVDDIGILGKYRTTIAHSPAAWACGGISLDSFDRYRKAGVNVALATDAFPLDMFAEMKMASVMGKKSEQNYEAAPADVVFHASNIAGANALGRPDLGRIAVGAKADIVIVDPRSLYFGPAPDPVSMLVAWGKPELVDTVMIDGKVLVENKEMKCCDTSQVIADAMPASFEDLEEAYSVYHPSGKRLTEQFRSTLENWPDD